MHPHLTGDSKKERCGDLIKALNECHAQSFLARLTGECNALKTELNHCLRAERIERTKRNNAEGRERTEQKKSIWRAIDEES
ncbi:hypothetical protein OC834_002684 [Tilletia horrida]|uniref:COX assembly mitochondrial protein n=1 Tax=Tilletia horrida TaxID=155126 RepID=A0AAN6GI89_9BASI|nr:hypothetical protein OC834_002684 [Tilletia horrida]KAK0541234.1 hypothetical protein OC842_000067 [Tilletia horrida]KAK0551714.1 hypothetical protein OC844_006536 [Tilletia horrida]